MKIQTNRQLLELAARAVGFTYDPTMKAVDGATLYGCYRTEGQSKYPWNPLKNPAQALEVAAILQLTLDLHWLDKGEIHIYGAYPVEMHQVQETLVKRIEAICFTIVQSAAAKAEQEES